MARSLSRLALAFLALACSSPSPEPSQSPPSTAGSAPAPTDDPVATAPAEPAEPALEPPVGGPTDLGEPGTIGVGPLGGRVSIVRPGVMTLSEGLSQEVVRRVVRRHINEVRFCYEQQLAAAPTLAGRITVHFTIAPSGAATEASIASSELASEGVPDGGEPALAVGTCLAERIDRWSFPEPDGGRTVTVDYPFALSTELPGEEAPSEPGTGTIGLGNIGTVGS